MHFYKYKCDKNLLLIITKLLESSDNDYLSNKYCNLLIKICTCDTFGNRTTHYALQIDFGNRTTHYALQIGFGNRTTHYALQIDFALHVLHRAC